MMIGSGNDQVEDAIEDQVLTLFEPAKSTKLEALSLGSRSEYEDRLQSFRAHTYYAKPNCLSPLVCARLGWRNADKDMLVCSFCNSALAIELISSLSTKTADKLCNLYREKLALAHCSNCPFKIEGEQFLRLQKTEEKSVVPTAMVSVLPQDCVELMDHPFPRPLLRKRVELLESKCPSSWVYPKLQISTDLTEYSNEENNDPLKKACQILETTETPAVLSILGWEPADVKEDETGTPTVSLNCHLCFSWMELTLEKEEFSENLHATEAQPEKRRKLVSSPRYRNPLESHRHYCPYKCGFPNSLFAEKKPVWKSVLSRLKVEKTRQDISFDSGYTVDKIQQLLRAAIAPKRIDLASEIDEENLQF